MSDPLANPLVGWWLEYYVWYVKLRDLDDRDDLTQMLLNHSHNVSALAEAADAKYYHGWSTINFAARCLKRCVEEYFRNEGEAWDTAELDNVPLASVDDKNWTHSISPEGTWDNPDVNLSDAGSAGGTSVLASEIEDSLRAWRMQSMMGLVSATYEDYLETYGIRVPQAELHIPELVRYERGWTYPTNTVEPSTGAPSSAVSWATAFRADKKRFFREPGFLFGVQVVRPKVYRATQTGSAAHLLVGQYPWLPMVMSDDPRSSLIPVADNTILGDVTDANGFIADIRDLYLYGDQFVNFSPSGITDGSFVALPTAGLQRRYASSSDADNLFRTPSGEDAAVTIESDGVVSLDIQSYHHQDLTPNFAGTAPAA